MLNFCDVQFAHCDYDVALYVIHHVSRQMQQVKNVFDPPISREHISSHGEDEVAPQGNPRFPDADSVGHGATSFN